MNQSKTYSIKGVRCGACIEMIKKTLSKVDGIEGIQADFDSKKITLDVTEKYNENTAFNAVSELGYQLQ